MYESFLDWLPLTQQLKTSPTFSNHLFVHIHISENKHHSKFVFYNILSK